MSRRNLPQDPILFEVVFIGRSDIYYIKNKPVIDTTTYAIQEEERTVGIDFVNHVRTTFDNFNIRLNQIECVIPFRLDCDVSLFMPMEEAAKCNDAFKHHNQIYYIVDEKIDESNALYIDVCQRPWSTGKEFIIDHSSIRPEPPLFENTSCVYFPCWQINPEALFDWWKDRGFPVNGAFPQPQQYDRLYAFYRTKFIADDFISSALSRDDATPEPGPYMQSLGDVRVNTMTRETKCVQWHSEISLENKIPEECEEGRVLYKWPLGEKLYNDSEESWMGDLSEDYVDGNIGGDILVGVDNTGDYGDSGWDSDFGDEWPGRFYDKYDDLESFEEGKFVGWQVYCCDHYVTKYYWANGSPRMPQFLRLWFRDRKIIEDQNHTDSPDSTSLNPYKTWIQYYMEHYLEDIEDGGIVY